MSGDQPGPEAPIQQGDAPHSGNNYENKDHAGTKG